MPTHNPSHPHSDASRALSGRVEMWASHDTQPRASLRSALGYVLSARWAGLAIHVAWVKWEILATSRAHSGRGEMGASNGTQPRASLRSALGYILSARWAGLAYRPQPGTKLTPLHPAALQADVRRPQRGPRFQPRAEGALATDALGTRFQAVFISSRPEGAREALIHP